MKKNIIFIIILFPFLVFSQDIIIEDTTNLQSKTLASYEVSQKTIDMILSQSISASPNASEFSKVGDLSVNEYSGVFSTSIPLFNLQSNGIELPISISYQTSGIRINDIPGNVGLGWSLNAGGVINRTVKGICDEMNYRIDGGQDGGEQMVGYQQLSYPYEGRGYDYLPDEFVVNVPGHLSSRFYFKINREVMEVPFLGNIIDEDRYDNGTEYDDFISSFQIIDKNGVEFNFNHVEKLETYSSVEMHTFYQGNHNHFTSSFFLSNIVNISNVTSFTFEYTPYSDLVFNNLDVKNKFLDYPNGELCETCTDQLFGMGYKTVPGTVESKREIIEGNRLSRILFQDGYLQFNYNHSRQDIPGDYAVTSIELYTLNDELVKGYKLSYDYFNSTGGEYPHYNKRLKLISIQEYGNDLDEIPPYIFAYNELTLAPRNTYMFDAWGYNNGISSNESFTTMYYYPMAN